MDGVAESIDVDASATLAAIEDEEIVVGGAGAYVDMDELKISGVGTSVRGYYKMNEKSGSALSNEITSVPCLAAHRHRYDGGGFHRGADTSQGTGEGRRESRGS